MQLSQVIQHMRNLAPEHLAEPWDKVGLAVGATDASVKKALLCVDLTESVFAEAVRKKSQLIVAYHPPIFKPLERLTDATWKQRIILEAARKQIAIYSPHTALDAAQGGVNDWLADGLGQSTRRAIKPAGSEASGGYKLVTFIPVDQADKLRSALSKAGAGQIGDYSQCSFGLEGEGTFFGGASTKPKVGKKGKLERVAELRLEMVVDRHALADVVAALREHHPYEEPAFDLYRLEAAPPADDEASEPCIGQGRVVELEEPGPLSAIAYRMKKHLGIDWIKVAEPEKSRRIKRVGLCAGAGGSLLDEAGDIDLFITGEMRHHDVLDALSRGIAVILAGHTNTERPYLDVYRKRLMTEVGKSVSWSISSSDKALMSYV